MSGTTMDQERCTACGSAHSHELMRLKGGTYRQCAECGCIFASPMPEDLESANEEVYTERLPAYAAKVETKKARNRRKLRMFDRYRHTGNLLEIGCNAGATLAVARQLGWNVKGVELCVSAGNFARDQLHLDVFSGTIEAAAFPGDSFDVVYTNAVLEHLRNPLSVLRECRRILRPGGIFYADTVNWDSYTRRLLGNHWKYLAPKSHVHLFTPESISSLCERAGLERLRTWTMGVRMNAGTDCNYRCPYYWRALRPLLSFLARRKNKGDHIRFLARKAME